MPEPQRVKLNAISRIRRMVIKNHDVPIKRVIEVLGEDRPTDFVVETVMAHTRDTVRELIRMGKLK